MSWLSTANCGIYTKGQKSAPSEIQSKVFHLQFDYRTWKPQPTLSPIKVQPQRPRVLTKQEKKQKRRLARKKKREKLLHRKQRAFQRAKSELLEDIFAEKGGDIQHIHDLMKMTWKDMKDSLLSDKHHDDPNHPRLVNTVVHSSLHQRLLEIHKKEMILDHSATKVDVKKLKEHERGGGERHDAVDDSIYALALEFADKKENESKIRVVQREHEAQKRQAGLQQYIEQEAMKKRSERNEQAAVASASAVTKVHDSITRPKSREVGRTPELLEPMERGDDDGVAMPTFTPIKKVQRGGDEEDIMDFIGQQRKPIDAPTADVVELPVLANAEATDFPEETHGHGAVEASPEVTRDEPVIDYSLSEQDPEVVETRPSSTIEYQASMTHRLIEARKRTWRLRQQCRPVGLQYRELPIGYEMLSGDQYTVRAYSHCNGFMNDNIVYVGVPPNRCCPTNGHPRHLYDMSYMLLEKCPEMIEKNKFVGKWNVPQFRWIMDFKTRALAIAFGERYGVSDIRF